MGTLKDYLNKTKKPMNEARRAPDFDPYAAEGEMPWYSDEYGDGWNHEVNSIGDILSVMDECQRLQYELNNARRGSYAVGGDTAEDLLRYCQELLTSFESAVNNLEIEIEQMGGE